MQLFALAFCFVDKRKFARKAQSVATLRGRRLAIVLACAGLLARTAENTGCEDYLSPPPNEKKEGVCLPFVGGGDKRIRTAGLLVANEALYQLSHIPVDKIYYISLLIPCQEFFNRYLKKIFICRIIDLL